ncbi:MAG: NADH-quinone oxidoreductase subunit C [Propionibacteriaceae bacterium]|nr:NADH-quinone oxidoreductase subunit C [Propionibacteriaceae bacterium]
MTDFEDVAPEQWRSRVTAARAEGFCFLAGMTAVDDIGVSNHIRVLLMLDDRTRTSHCRLATAVDRDNPALEGIAQVFRGAAWLQRQIHDFFGVEFIGDDNRPLLNHQSGAPLRKDFLLQPRLDARWPGALEPGESDASPGRRRIVPPGVPDVDVLTDEDATAADIALSAAGTRVRRRR